MRVFLNVDFEFDSDLGDVEEGAVKGEAAEVFRRLLLECPEDVLSVDYDD